MKVRNISLALGLMAALNPAVHPSFAQTANPQDATNRSDTPIAASARTAVPSLVPYSGAAIANDGKALTGEAGFTFLIYKDEVGGEPLWAETQSVAIDATGHYKVQLGATNPNGLPSDLFATGEARWLEVQIAGENPQPRILIASVPYALKAGDATTLGGLPASAYALAKMNATPANSGAVTPALVTDVTTTGGTSGYLPVFNGAATIVDSPVFVLGADVGIGTATPTATLDVNGTALITGAMSTDSSAAFGGAVTVEAAGKATTAAGDSSHSLALQASSYNSGASEAVPQTFAFKAVPVGNDTSTASASLQVLFGQGTATPAATGLAIGANGQITFAAGQKFPGTGTGTITGVTAGTDLTGGGTTGAVILNLDTAKVPLLGSSNHFTANQSVTGSVTATSFSGSGAGLSGVTAANSAELGGLAPAAFAELAASNKFSATQSFSKVGIGTATPTTILEVSASAPNALGPTITLTNRGGGGGASASVDFNTEPVPAPSIYVPGARIAAIDNSEDGDFLTIATKNFDTGTLETEMWVYPTSVGIGTEFPDAALEADAVSGWGIWGSAGPNTSGVDGFGGISGGGEAAGAGGAFFGGTSIDTSTGGDGVQGFPGSSNGGGATGWAGYFQGSVDITGTLFAEVKDFKIDHPLDPANKYLVHTSVESSEMMNIYTGNVTTDELGIATITLPDWFQSLNTDYRYQLTTIGRDAHAWVSQEVANNQFKISTNASNVKVSWQITAVRQDAYAKANPLVVEEQKPAAEKGFYIHPELFGQSADKQTEWGRHPQEMQRMKAAMEAKKNRLTGAPAKTRPGQPVLKPTALNQNHAEVRPVSPIEP